MASSIELLLETERQFDVQLASEDHGFSETFGLGENESLFHSEGIDPFGPFGHGQVREFTVGELYDALCRLNDDRPPESQRS